MNIVGKLVLLALIVAAQPAAATTLTFANSAGITIVDNASATPFPSVISTPGGDWSLYVFDDSSGAAGSISSWEVILDIVSGSIADVDIHLLGVNHNFFSDIDMWLKGPNGVGVGVTSDNGGGARAVNLDLTFDDEAAASITTMPGSGILSSPLRFKPENDVLPSNHPLYIRMGLLGTGTSFAAFDGLPFEQTDPASPVPEPATLTLVGAGLGWIARRARRGAALRSSQEAR